MNGVVSFSLDDDSVCDAVLSLETEVVDSVSTEVVSGVMVVLSVLAGGEEVVDSVSDVNGVTEVVS